MTGTFLLTIDTHGIATLMFNRPDHNNALNDELISGLHTQLSELEHDSRVRILVLTGVGNAFCAGGDLTHMQAMSKMGDAENFADALAVARCLRKLREFPKPVIARVNGHASGGGVGLICCADIAVATEQARFSLPEVRIGMSAAIISPYVIAALGARQAAYLMLTGMEIDATAAQALGLIHRTVDAQQLDAQINREIELILQGGPEAQRVTKQLIRDVVAMTSEEHDMLMAKTARALARLRAGAEAREGMQAAAAKRKPGWTQ